MPRVDMTGYEHKIIAPALDFGHRHTDTAPARVGDATKRAGDRCRLQGLTDTVTVRIVDRDYRNGRYAVFHFRCRGTPYVGHDSFVQDILIARPHVNVTNGACFLG